MAFCKYYPFKFCQIPQKIKTLFIIFIILSFAGFLRYRALIKSELIFDGDEALIGLMAKHIIENKIRPVFVYGQDYMGSFEGYTVALLFSIFGNSIYVLKSAPAFYSLLLLIFVFILIAKLFNKKIAMLSILFWTAPPYLILQWSLSPTGGHIENLLFVFILFLLAYKYFETRKNAAVLYSFFLISGFAFWVNPFSIFVIFSFLILFLYDILKNKEYRKTFLFFYLAIFFTIGCLSLVYYNIQNNFITFKKLAAFFLGISSSAYHSADTQIHILIFQKIIGMLTNIPLGIIKISKSIILNSGNYYFDGLIYFSVLIYTIIVGLKSKTNFFKLVGLYSLIIFILFSISSRAADRERYILVFYPAITIGIFHIISHLQNNFKKIAVLVFIIIILLNLTKILKIEKTKDIQNFFDKYRATEKFLISQNIKYVYADMYIAYPLAYLSDERIIASPAAGFYNEDRIPSYTNIVSVNKSNTFIFFKDSYSSQALISKLTALNISFKKHTIFDFDIFYDFSEYIEIAKLDLPKRFRKKNN